MDKSEGKDWFAKTLNSVTEETAKVYKISRLKFELGTIAKAKHEKLNLMGRRLIEYINSGKIDKAMFEPEYSTIMKLEDKKNNVEAEIDGIRNNIKIGFGDKNQDEDDGDIIKIIGTENIDMPDKENNAKKRRK